MFLKTDVVELSSCREKEMWKREAEEMRPLYTGAVRRPHRSETLLVGTPPLPAQVSERKTG
jgi:hypothetical protein